ncbi:hypothetical protein CIT292_10980 [Citrobacter youngae ATCC 29220]|uniref:Uncharacterized protein n=1 Tax=Citrobacter youngae ATCC 29220 TaxID=500640 RepID=D4BJY6_9ENTR|nr:hypothetical protein CIT292_10980 [Citrobacter youngae ATCC 29220]
MEKGYLLIVAALQNALNSLWMAPDYLGLNNLVYWIVPANSHFQIFSAL